MFAACQGPQTHQCVCICVGAHTYCVATSNRSSAPVLFYFVPHPALRHRQRLIPLPPASQVSSCELATCLPATPPSHVAPLLLGTPRLTLASHTPIQLMWHNVRRSGSCCATQGARRRPWGLMQGAVAGGTDAKTQSIVCDGDDAITQASNGPTSQGHAGAPAIPAAAGWQLRPWQLPLRLRSPPLAAAHCF